MRNPARFLGVLVLLIAVFGAAIIYSAESENVTLTVGRSMVLDTGHPIARVSLTSADIADAMVTSASELLINGKTPGAISMFVWDRAGSIRRYEVIVQRDLARLSTQLQELFPGEAIAAQNNGRSIVLSGTVSNKDVIDRAVSVAAGYVEKKDDVVPLLQVQPGRSNQVLLHVRFAEVSRSALTELGAGFFTSPTGVKQTIGRVTTEQFPSVGFDELKYTKPIDGFGKDVTSNSGKFTFSDFLNLFLFSEKYDLGLMIRALQSRGLFQSLAEPNLVAETGKEASFLAGGEIPVPVAQGTGGNVAISVSWKEFGIRLNFTPVVSGNRVHLKVRPEVSTLDFNNAVVLQGFRIPALSTRRTETELELESGQTFAIAGLMNNTMTSSLQKIPGIGDIPILGLLFQSKAAQKGQTELVVMITPEILASGSSGVTSNLPRQVEPYMPPVKKTFDPPSPAFQTPSAAPRGAGQEITTPAVAMPAPAAAVPAPAAAPTQTPAPAPVMRPEETPMPDAKAQAAEAKRQAKLAEEERRKAEQSAKEADAQKKHDEQLAREQAKRDQEAAAEQAKRDEKAAREKARQDEKAAREQLKRDSSASKKQAEIDKAARDAAALRAEAAAREQAEIEKRKQKALDEAHARLRAAEVAYQAELAKRGARNQ